MDVIRSKLSSVRSQDIILITLCALAVYICRVRDKYILEPQWRKDINISTLSPMDTRREPLPLPIVTDLDGNGISEVVLVTDDLHLEVLVVPQEGEGNVLPHVEVRARVRLAVNVMEDGSLSHPVAMETGFLEEYTSSVRKQIIVVVLNDWTVLCYSNSLQLLWQQKMMDVGNAHGEYFVKSMGILITPSGATRSDTGMVVVGGSFAHRAHHKLKKERLEQYPGDKLDPARLHTQHTHHIVPRKVDTLTHFSTFALSGQNGTIRWHHLPGDFKQKKPKEMAQPHHWKLTLQKHYLHIGESHWSKYSGDIIKQLPHGWNILTDTRFELASVRPDGYDPKESSGPSSMVTDLLGLQGEHIVGYAYGGMKPHSHHEHVRSPNAVVIHNHEGIEVLSFTTGRPLTELTLPHIKGVYADVDRDNSVDQIKAEFSDDNCEASVVSIFPVATELFTGPLCHAPGLWGDVTFFPETSTSENTPVAVRPLVVPSVATRSGPFSHLMGHSLPSLKKGYDSIFLTSTGRLTSYSPHGDFNWQVVLPTKWADIAQRALADTLSHSEQLLFFHGFQPSINSLSPQIYGKETAAAVQGWNRIALVDLHDGYLMADHSLPCTPVQTPVIADFNGDGWTDVIIGCPSGLLAFSLHGQPNYMYLTLISLGVILVILILAWVCRPEAHLKDSTD